MTDNCTIKWIEVDPANFNSNKRKDVDGVKVTIGLSPHDLPEAVGGCYDDQIDRFVIELKYLGSEEEVVPISHENVTLQVGKKSGRIRQIHINVKALQADAIDIQLESAIPDGIKKAIFRYASKSKTSQSGHFRAARDVIMENRERLLADLQLCK